VLKWPLATFWKPSNIRICIPARIVYNPSMKAYLPVCLAVVMISGCSALSNRQIAHYKDYDISGPLYAKIQAHQPLTHPDIVELSQHQVPSQEIMAYLAFSNTDLKLSDYEVQELWQEKVNGDVITYLRENPNRTGGLLATFSPEFYNQVGTPVK
jgi:hypothetical protein